MARNVLLPLMVIYSIVCFAAPANNRPQTHGTENSTSAAPVNNRPIIGVLTQPQGTENSTSNGTTSYIAASYVKWLESAGARVVPVHYDAPEAEITSLLGHLNGIVYPGGGTDLRNTSHYAKTGKLIFDWALNANDRGEYFPVWATCLGFEQVIMLAAHTDTVLCNRCFKADGLPLPLDYTSNAKKSRLLGPMAVSRPALYKALSIKNLTENSHSSGVAPAVFEAGAPGGNEKVAAFYDVLSTNSDSKGRKFVSTIEAKNYPVYSTQWHPEKNLFEWGVSLGPNAIPHGADATAVSQFLVDFFISETRKSKHKFDTVGEESAALIYNNSPVKDPSGYFEQVYVWKKQ